MTEPVKISAVVITFNEEKNIQRCIESITSVADEVIVVDCFSTDRTKEICQQLGVTFIQSEFLGFARQKNYAVSLATHQWVLSLDADEYLSKELAESIRKIKSAPDSDGYSMNRMSSYAGEWIRTCGWYPDTKLRLWKKSKALWKGEGVHEWVELLPGHTIKRLRGDLLHHAYENISQFLLKIQRYSEIYAHANRFKVRVSGTKIFYKTIFAFFKSYILKRGITDGYKGLLISFCNANFVFYKYSKLLEENERLRTSLIISAPERPKALELTLLSALNQSVLPQEIVVADGKYRAVVQEVLDNYKDRFAIPLLYSYADANMDASQSKRAAIQMASSEFIIHADSDMILPRHFVKAHKKVVQRGRFSQGKQVPLTREETQQIFQLQSTRALGWRNRFGTIAQLLALTQLALPKAFNVSFWKEDFQQAIPHLSSETHTEMFETQLVNGLVNYGLEKYELDFAGYAYHLHQ